MMNLTIPLLILEAEQLIFPPNPCKNKFYSGYFHRKKQCKINRNTSTATITKWWDEMKLSISTYFAALTYITYILQSLRRAVVRGKTTE